MQQNIIPVPTSKLSFQVLFFAETYFRVFKSFAKIAKIRFSRKFPLIWYIGKVNLNHNFAVNMNNFSVADYLTKIVTNLTHDNEMHKQYEKKGISTEGNTLSVLRSHLQNSTLGFQAYSQVHYLFTPT